MLVRDPETKNLCKTMDESWPRCSCGRCVFEDMEFPVYYGDDENDPFIIEFGGRKEERGLEARPDISLALGIWIDECPNCGDVFHSEKRQWVHWEEPDIQFEITHYFRRLLFPFPGEEDWMPLGFVTRQVGTSEYFQEFTTWRTMSPGHIEEHEREGWAIRLPSPILVKRGATMWMSSDCKVWLSSTDLHEDGTIVDEGRENTSEQGES